MKLTWTFYPRGQSSVTLTVIYDPALDAIPGVGWLDKEANTAYVNWSLYRVFDSLDTKAKRNAFQLLSLCAPPVANQLPECRTS